jgi:hypothetical protein
VALPRWWWHAIAQACSGFQPQLFLAPPAGSARRMRYSSSATAPRSCSWPLHSSGSSSLSTLHRYPCSRINLRPHERPRICVCVSACDTGSLCVIQAPPSKRGTTCVIYAQMETSRLTPTVPEVCPSLSAIQPRRAFSRPWCHAPLECLHAGAAGGGGVDEHRVRCRTLQHASQHCLHRRRHPPLMHCAPHLLSTNSVPNAEMTGSNQAAMKDRRRTDVSADHHVRRCVRLARLLRPPIKLRRTRRATALPNSGGVEVHVVAQVGQHRRQIRERHTAPVAVRCR